MLLPAGCLVAAHDMRASTPTARHKDREKGEHRCPTALRREADTTGSKNRHPTAARRGADAQHHHPKTLFSFLWRSLSCFMDGPPPHPLPRPNLLGYSYSAPCPPSLVAGPAVAAVWSSMAAAVLRTAASHPEQDTVGDHCEMSWFVTRHSPQRLP